LLFCKPHALRNAILSRDTAYAFFCCAALCKLSREEPRYKLFFAGERRRRNSRTEHAGSLSRRSCANWLYRHYGNSGDNDSSRYRCQPSLRAVRVRASNISAVLSPNIGRERT